MREIYKFISIIDKYNKYYLDQKLFQYGLSSTHTTVLLHVIKHKGITQDKLKDKMHIHPSNITRALDTLEEKGYIKKEKNHSDKRTSYIYETEKGLSLFNEVEEYKRVWMGVITKSLTDSEKEIFVELSKRIAKNAKNYFYPNKEE